MQTQSHSSLALEGTANPSNQNNIDINDSLKKLKHTIKNLKREINAIDETWLFGSLTDHTIKQLKNTLLL